MWETNTDIIGSEYKSLGGGIQQTKKPPIKTPGTHTSQRGFIV
jgi:hypothetical protein